MNQQTIKTFLLLCLTAPCFIGAAQEAEIHYLESTALNERRSYQVGLPDSYDSKTTSYPVLVMLDGDYRFDYASAIVRYLSLRGLIPEMIVVGIPNTDRTRDLTPTDMEQFPGGGGADAFLDFIGNELMPEVDARYRTQPYRILSGHSYGGLATTYAYTHSKLFNAFIATDPSLWWGNLLLHDSIDHDLIEQRQKSKLFIASADKISGEDSPVRFMRNPHELFFAKMKIEGLHSSQIALQYFPEESHGSSAMISFYRGLRWLFQDYKMPNIYDSSPSDIKRHYETFSTKMHAHFAPSEKQLEKIASYKLQKESQFAEGLEMIELLCETYPSDKNRKRLESVIPTFGSHQNLQLFPLQETVKTQKFVGEKHTINSRILGEIRSYSVAVPANYKAGDHTYPVVYFLDGDIHLPYAKAVVENMSRESQLPEVILVGISTHPDPNRDFTPTPGIPTGDEPPSSKLQSNHREGSLFMEFLEKELVPMVDAAYRTKNLRVLVGQSSAGLACTEAYLNGCEFDCYISIDPNMNWNEGHILSKLAKTDLETFVEKKFFFSGTNSLERTSGKPAKRQFSQELFYAQARSMGFDYQKILYRQYPGEDRESLPLISLYDGLQYVFSEFQIDPSAIYTAEEIQKHFRNLSEKYNDDFYPAQNVLMGSAWFKLDTENNPQAAFSLFNLMKTIYPNFASFQTIGYAHLKQGNVNEAKSHFLQARELAIEAFQRDGIDQILSEIDQAKSEPQD
jgi:predicted alpha/beta superfamily hydrolase